jgi:hypothetical protein
MAQEEVLEDEVLARARHGSRGGGLEPEEIEHIVSIADL